MVRFTERCEAAIRGVGIDAFHHQMELQLEAYTAVDVSQVDGGDDVAAAQVDSERRGDVRLERTRPGVGRSISTGSGCM